MRCNKRLMRESFIELCSSCRTREGLRKKLNVANRTLLAYAERYDVELGNYFGNKQYRRKIPKTLFKKYKNDTSTPVKDLLQKFNVPAKTFYRRLPAEERRNYRPPDSPELRKRIISTYIQEHSVLSTAKRLSLNRTRVTTILKEAKFKIPRFGTVHIKDHFNGSRYNDIHPHLMKLVDGISD
jgi:hypothetical protein